MSKVQDVNIRKNAFNQKADQQYYYQASDIRLIQNEVMAPYRDSFVIHNPIGDGEAVDQVLITLITSLNTDNPTLCIYNLGNFHWVAFAVLKINEQITVLYKDSKGKANVGLEQKIKIHSNDVKFIVNAQNEQTSGVECGIFALKNIEIMAQRLGQNKEVFVNGFKNFKEFCSLKDAKSLRAEEFAKQYVMGKYHEIINGHDKSVKLEKLRERHGPEAEEIVLKLKEAEYFKNFNVVFLKATEKLAQKQEATITIEIASAQDTDPEDINYTYKYRICLSEDLVITTDEVIKNISQVLEVPIETFLSFTTKYEENIVIGIPSVQVSSITKIAKQVAATVDMESPLLITTKLLDSLDLGKSLSLKKDIKLIFTELFSDEDPYDLHPETELDFNDKPEPKPEQKKSPKDKYEIEGDDSSDEELEQKIYYSSLDAKHYSSLDTEVKGIKLLKYNTTKLGDIDQKTIEEIITKIEVVKGFTTPQKKISHAKKTKEGVISILNALGDSPAKKEVQDAYEECKSKDPTELKTLATKKFLCSEKVPELSSQSNEDGAPLLDLKWSLIFQDLGIRLLMSSPVRELYFPNKEKLGKFDNLPTDEMIRQSLENVVKNTLEKHKKVIPSVLKHESYTSLVNALLEDKRKVFSLPEPTNNLNNLLNALLKTMNELIFDQHQPISPVEAIGERRVESIIKKLEEINGFVTPSKKTVSKTAKVKSEVLAQLKKTTTFGTLYNEAIEEAYTELKSNKKISDLTTLAKQKLTKNRKEAKKEEELDSGSDLVPNLQDEIAKLKGTLLHPVLPDSTSFSPRDITDDAQYSGAETLFCYLRLIHCSAKRFIKNAKLIQDFDGAAFSRGWQFDTEKKLGVIETQSLSSGHSLTSMVLYPHDSSYAYLYTKLKDFQNKTGITDDGIISNIKSILKNGKIPEELHINTTFERFLTVLTYHLFGTEVERHPAAAIHNIMALDLVQTKGFNWAFKHLPMAIKDATPVARGIQVVLHKKLALPYYYDSSNANAIGPETEAFQEFIVRERELVSTWLESRSLTVELSDKVLTQIDDLCFDYYGIRLAGEDNLS